MSLAGGVSFGKTRVDTLIMPPEKHISAPKQSLLLALRAALPEDEDRARFAELAALMEGVASFDFIDVKERMRTNFLPFASGARNQVYLQRSSKGLPTTTSLDTKELEFVGDVFEALRASHFHVLTAREWKIAQAESFKLTLPLEIEWEYMDDALLKRFWDSTPNQRQLRQHLPDEMADRILVMHRGVGTATLKGLLIGEKLDLLCDYTVVRLINAALSFVPKKWGGTKLPKEELEAKQGRKAARERALRSSQTLMRQYSTLQAKVQGGAYVASDHKFAKAVERVTLKRLCPSVPRLLLAFPRVLELQEPTFKEVVVVYRRAFPPRKAPTSAADAPNRGKEDRMRGILSRRNIYVKVFGETPMADVELVIPAKKPQVKPFQLVNLAVTVATALVTGAYMLIKAGKDVNMNVLWTAGSLVLTRIFQVYSSAQTQKAQLQQDMGSELFDKMRDSQEGVVGVVMEEMARQQFMQMMLAYVLLVAHGGPMLVEDLDEACEDFLVRGFDDRIDFQVEDALPRLERWGLVTRSPQDALGDVLTARPVPDAVATLTAAWASAYRALGARAAGVATADLLSGRASAFGAGVDAYLEEKESAAGAAVAAAAALAGGAKARTAAFFGKAKGGLKALGAPKASRGGGEAAADDASEAP